MSFSRPLVVIAFMAIMALVVGCSGSGPVFLNEKTGANESLPIFGYTDAGDASNAIGLLGAYELTFDPNTLTADLVAKRLTSAVGDSYLVSGMGFFTVAPCGNCFSLSGVEITTGNDVLLSFDIRHPFSPGDPGNPPTARNRLDLDVFDMAVVVYKGDATQTQFKTCDVYAGICMNPTGYTTELDTFLDNDGAMPYYLVVDDSISGTATYNEFPMGGTGTIDIVFDLGTSPLTFDMYLTFGYGQSAKKLQRLTPTYFNPEFNRKNAWKVVVTPPQGTDPPVKGNTWENQDTTTPYTVEVKVYDWQHGNASVAYPPVNPTDISASSNVSSVIVEIPGMNVTMPSSSTVVSGTGAPNDPLIFNVSFANENGLLPGEYLSLVKVLDERIPASTVGTYDFLIDSPNGVALNNYLIPEFATYQTFIATVVNSCGPITGSITSPTCPITDQGNGALINFVVSASSVGGNPIVLYEWDHDYVGGVFTPEGSNTTGTLNGVGPFDIPAPCPSNIPKTFTVAFRAKDSCVPPNNTIFATCQVTVTNCCNNQELLYDFASCTTYSTSCVTAGQGTWIGGGCSLPNTDSWPGWGHFSFGCNANVACTEITYPYVTSGSDSGGCTYLNDLYYPANMNLVSPTFNIPASNNGTFEFDRCFSNEGGGTLSLYVSTNGCTGPWTSIWLTTTAGCVPNEQVDIHTYAGNNVMFRFEYSGGSGFMGSNNTCGTNTGVVLDNIRIFGCFNGTLAGI